MIILGLTGGVASGKNYVADFFKRKKIRVFDADAAVHEMLARDQKVISQLKKTFPELTDQINREVLAKTVFGNSAKLKKLEAIIHPEVRKRELQFIKKSLARNEKMVVLNIPLLIERIKYSQKFQFRQQLGIKAARTVVVSLLISKTAQQNRFIKRSKNGTRHTSESIMRLNSINKRQADNLTRKKLADFVIYSGPTKPATLRQINAIYHKSAEKYPAEIHH